MRVSLLLLAENKPNLVFRKAKITGKSVEQLMTAKVPVPRFKEEALFGIFPVLEGLEAGRRTAHRLFIKDSVRERVEEDNRVARILELAGEKKVPVNRITQAQLDKITEFQLHNGVCLDASPLVFRPPGLSRISVFLDGVLDPGNIGAIARSCLFFGCHQLIYLKGRGPSSITPTMSKASCGAVERLRVVCLEDPNELTTKFPDALIVGTSDPASAERYQKKIGSVNDLHLPQKNIVLVLGDEHKGITPEMMARCHLLTSIPGSAHRTGHVSSLNVSVVAGILLQTISNKSMI